MYKKHDRYKETMIEEAREVFMQEFKILAEKSMKQMAVVPVVGAVIHNPANA